MTSSIFALVVLAASAVASPTPSPSPAPAPAAADGEWIAVPYPCVRTWEFFGDDATPASQLHGFVVSQRVKDRVWTEADPEHHTDLYWAWDKANRDRSPEERRKAFDAMFEATDAANEDSNIHWGYGLFEMQYRLCEHLMGPSKYLPR